MESKTYNVDVRNVIIIALILFCVWLYFNPFNNSNKIDDLEKDNKNKTEQITKIQSQRDSLTLERKNLDTKIEILKKITESRKDSIKYLQSISIKKEIQIIGLKDDLKTWEEFLKERERKIEELERNPIILPKNQLADKTAEKLN